MTKSRSFRLARFAVLAALALFSSAIAHADVVPGDACSPNNVSIWSGGPETSGKVYLMTCQGGVWVRIMETATTGNVGIGTATPRTSLDLGGKTDALVLQTGTTGQRPASPVDGMVRYNSTTPQIEAYYNSIWNSLGGGGGTPVWGMNAVNTSETTTSTSYTNLTTSGPAVTIATDTTALVILTAQMSNSNASKQCNMGFAVSGATTTAASDTYALKATSAVANGVSAVSAAFYVDVGLTAGSNTFTAKYAATSNTCTFANRHIIVISSTGMSGCASEGTVCSDGTVYAGLSGVGTPMYVTRCDSGQTWSGSACAGTRTTTCWNYCNTTGYVATGQTGTTDGQTYTANLITIDSDSGVAGTQQHGAAQYCADLSAGGHSDWYLPARNELNTLYTNATAIGGFDTSGNYYWSSSEYDNGNAWYRNFSDGTQSPSNKGNSLVIRCARR